MIFFLLISMSNTMLISPNATISLTLKDACDSIASYDDEAHQYRLYKMDLEKNMLNLIPQEVCKEINDKINRCVQDVEKSLK